MVAKKSYKFGYSTAFAIVIVILLAVLVMAARGDTILVRNPAAHTNYSAKNLTTGQGTIGTLFNITFLNGSEASAAISNATFWVNTSGTNWVILGNSTHCYSAGASGSLASCTAVLNATAQYDGTLLADGFYTINATIYNGTRIGNSQIIPINLSNMTTVIRVDNNVNVDIATLNSGTNHSTTSNGGNLTLNVSIPDLVPLNIDRVMFNVINSAGAVNATATAVREGSSTSWSASINTAHFPNGRYNITVSANDTLGNFNVTANNSGLTAPINSLIFDNTAPTVTFSCTPGNVQTGDTVTCSCSGSATSGINSTSFTVNPDTGNTGTHTETCTVVSRSGLSTQATAEYNVESSGSGGGSGTGGGSGGGSSGGTTSWTTYPVSDEDLSSGTTRDLATNQRLQFEVDAETHYVGVKSLTATSVVIEVSSDPQEATMAPGESKKFEVTGDNYYDLEVTVESIESNRAEVTVRSVHEIMPESETGSQDGTGDGATEEGAGLSTGWMIAIIVIIIIIVGLIWFMKRRR